MNDSIREASTNASIRSSKWWRFKKYTICGRAVRPEAGQEPIPYDLWEPFEAVQGKYRTVKTLWGEFMETARQVQADAPHGYTPSAQGESLILDWCQKYGLLGILPGQAQVIILPPTYVRSDEYRGGTSRKRLILQRKHARIAGRWVTPELAIREDSATAEDDSGWRPGDLVPQSQWPDSIEAPRTLFWGWENFEWQAPPDNENLLGFFAQPPSHGQYPQPLSPDFWRTYQEPVVEWMRAAVVFSQSAELVSRYAAARYSNQPWPAEQVSLAKRALWLLNSLSTSESYAYEFGPSTLKRESVSASLLSAMAEMFLLDIMDRRRVLRCGTCHRFMISNDVKARYCCVRCRNTAQTRRYRQKAKQQESPQ